MGCDSAYAVDLSAVRSCTCDCVNVVPKDCLVNAGCWVFTVGDSGVCSYVPSVGAWHQANVSAVPFVHLADLWRTAELQTLQFFWKKTEEKSPRYRRIHQCIKHKIIRLYHRYRNLFLNYRVYNNFNGASNAE